MATLVDARRATRGAAAVGVAGAIAIALGLVFEPHRALAAYLVAWVAATTVAIGALAMQLIGYACNAKWPAAIRRLCDVLTGALAPLAVLVVPLLVGARDVWPWVEPSTPELEHAVAVKAAWLNLPAFAVRTVIYLAAFVVVAELLAAWSRRRDRAAPPDADPPVLPPGVDALDRERRFACAMVLPLGLLLSFAGFDWVMSLQPAWSSTVFGLYVTAGALAGGLAAVIVLAWWSRRARLVPLTGNHFHAMGRLLLAFSILWTYLAYFQAFLIQIADRPDEVTFYQARTVDGWRGVTLALVALRIALPFPALMSRRLKHRPSYLAAIAGVALVGHYLDMWWLVIPAIVPGGPGLHWTDLAAICAVFGIAGAVAARRAHRAPLIAIADPYLRRGLDYASST